MEMITTPKTWASPKTFALGWGRPFSGKIPAQFSLQAVILFDGELMGGCKVSASFKRSPNGFSRDSLSFSLIVDNVRVVGIDDKPHGKGGHPNRVGKGMSYYGKVIDHPHIHFPIEGACYGYAEPLDSSMTHNQFWELFLEKCNISGAPPFERPPEEQIGLGLL